jgi:hypothetical protein
VGHGQSSSASSCALKRECNLDDAFLEDLKEELLYGQKLAVDEDGKGLVWMGNTALAAIPASTPARDQEREPLSYTPKHLAEKILTSRCCQFSKSQS